MILEIVTPEATLISTEVDIVSVPGINGEFQMLNNHAPIVSLLNKGAVKFSGGNINIEKRFKERFHVDKEGYSIQVNGGTIEMRENKIIVLAD